MVLGLSCLILLFNRGQVIAMIPILVRADNALLL